MQGDKGVRRSFCRHEGVVALSPQHREGIGGRITGIDSTWVVVARVLPGTSGRRLRWTLAHTSGCGGGHFPAKSFKAVPPVVCSNPVGGAFAAENFVDRATPWASRLYAGTGTDAEEAGVPGLRVEGRLRSRQAGVAPPWRAGWHSKWLWFPLPVHLSTRARLDAGGISRLREPPGATTALCVGIFTASKSVVAQEPRPGLIGEQE
eukprot:scaffold189165_cov28-Tisochrysis_lutea.AAC.4